MAEAEETPAQRQARIRREKREAKINANAQERLDKITQLSGRTPETIRKQSPAVTPGTVTPTSPPIRQSPPHSDGMSPEQARMQEEYLRTLLRGPPPGANGQNQSTQQPGEEEEDPMMQMLQSLMGSMGGESDPSNPGGVPFSPDVLAKQAGLPAWATGMLFGGQKVPPTPAEQQSVRRWRIIHVVVAVISGLYMLFALDKSVRTFGPNPPAPATFQNPFVVFVMAQLILQSTRMLTAGRMRQSGPRFWYQMLKELAGDGAIIVFMLGCASWWKSYT